MFLTLFKPSLRFLRSHLFLICFMVVTFATWLLATLLITVLMQNSPTIQASFIRICSLYYICYLFCMFSFVFFQAIFIQTVAAQLQNQRPATWDNITYSCSKIYHLFIWSLLKAHLYLISPFVKTVRISLKTCTYINYLIIFKSMSTYQAGQEIFVMQHRQSLKAVSFGSTLTCIFILTYVILTKLIIYLYPAQRVILYNIWMIILPYLGIGAFTGFLSGIVNTAVYLRLFEKINTPYFSEEMLELLAPQVKKEP